MVKGQVCAIKTMIDGDIRITINVPQEAVPNDIITWRFEDVVLVTKADIGTEMFMGLRLEQTINDKKAY
jgi:hypothetical protein